MDGLPEGLLLTEMLGLLDGESLGLLDGDGLELGLELGLVEGVAEGDDDGEEETLELGDEIDASNSTMRLAKADADAPPQVIVVPVSPELRNAVSSPDTWPVV